MNSLVLTLDAEKLENPDFDLRYAVPDLLSARSNGNIYDNGYDYEDQENQNAPQSAVFLNVADLHSAIATISHVVQHESVLSNNLSLSATLYVVEEDLPLIFHSLAAVPNITVKVAPSGRWTCRKRAALFLQRYASSVAHDHCYGER